jgi:hypothetical protein
MVLENDSMKRNLPKVTFADESAMRAFYQSCGISERTTEAAIEARRNKLVEETKSAVSSDTPHKVRP